MVFVLVIYISEVRPLPSRRTSFLVQGVLCCVVLCYTFSQCPPNTHKLIDSLLLCSLVSEGLAADCGRWCPQRVPYKLAANFGGRVTL